MNRRMAKPTIWHVCAQRRLKSAYITAILIRVFVGQTVKRTARILHTYYMDVPVDPSRRCSLIRVCIISAQIRKWIRVELTRAPFYVYFRTRKLSGQIIHTPCKKVLSILLALFCLDKLDISVKFHQ